MIIFDKLVLEYVKVTYFIINATLKWGVSNAVYYVIHLGHVNQLSHFLHTNEHVR